MPFFHPYASQPSPQALIPIYFFHILAKTLFPKGKEPYPCILASNPDHEEEAIAWHIAKMLQQQDSLHANLRVARVVFHEITELAIKSSLQDLRDMSANLVHAYLARQALDYLIGFSILPLLWRKLPGFQSAGRVQSTALALICDRETKIDDFDVQEYWSIDAKFHKAGGVSMDQSVSFLAHITQFDSNKLEKFSISSHTEAQDIVQKVMSSEFRVLETKRSEMHKNPPALYITLSLHLDAANKLKFSASQIMKALAEQNQALARQLMLASSQLLKALFQVIYS